MGLQNYIADANAELPFEATEALGLDGTGRDGDERFPYTWSNLTDDERRRLRAYDAAI